MMTTAERETIWRMFQSIDATFADHTVRPQVTEPDGITVFVLCSCSDPRTMTPREYMVHLQNRVMHGMSAASWT